MCNMFSLSPGKNKIVRRISHQLEQDCMLSRAKSHDIINKYIYAQQQHSTWHAVDHQAIGVE